MNCKNAYIPVWSGNVATSPKTSINNDGHIEPSWE